MFRIITLLFAISLVFISCSSKPDFSGKFGYSPTSPSPGDEVTIFYNPDSTNLAGNRRARDPESTTPEVSSRPLSKKYAPSDEPGIGNRKTRLTPKQHCVTIKYAANDNETDVNLLLMTLSSADKISELDPCQIGFYPPALK